ncbi:MAG: O-antigen ligase family protein [Candidatus Portnoybacteria bacterium]|nr:O-antigen ligase family protein [Candidatus Portnoybacteria bacterium]
MEKVIRFLLYATLITPLFVFRDLFFPYIPSKMLALEGLILAAVVIWLYLWQKNPERYAPKITWLSVALGGYIFIQFVAALQGVNFWRSFYSTYERMDGIFIWISLALFFLVSSSLFRQQKDWLWFFRISLAVSIIVGLKAVDLFGALGGKLDIPTHISAVFNSPIYLGIYAFFHVGIALILLYSLDRQLRTFKDFFPFIKSVESLFYSIGFVANGLVVFLTFARGVMLGTLAGIVVFILWYLLWGKERAILLKTVGITLAFLVISFPFWKDSEFASRMFSITKGFSADPTRVINWQVGFDAFEARPLLGWGPYNYLAAQNESYNPHLQYLINQAFDKVHNKYIEIAVDTGILGITSYAGIFLLIFLSLWKARKKEPFLTALFAGIFSGYLVQNITAFDSPGSYLPLFLLLAFVNAEFFEPLRFQLKPAPSLVVSCCLLVSVFIWQGVWQPWRANVVLANTLLKQQAKEKDLEGILKGYKEALFYQSMGDYEIRIQLGTFVVNEQELTRELLDTAISELEKESKISRQDVLIHTILAKLYEREGVVLKDKAFFEKAEKELLRSLELSPKRPDSYHYYAAFLLNQGRSQDVRKAMEEIKKLDKDIYENKKTQWYIGASYYVEDNFQKAYEQFQSVLSRGENFGSPDEFFVIAQTAFNLGKYQEAFKWYQDLYYTDPANPQYNIYFALAYRQIGNKSEAKKYARRAAEINPELTKQVEEFLQSLK